MASRDTEQIRRAVEDLHARYIRTIDDDRIEDWPALFTPDGLYRIITRENYDQDLPLAVMECQGRPMMEDRVTGLRRINVYEPQRYSHQISGLVIDHAAEGCIECRSNYLVIRTMATGAMTTFAVGVYLDRVVIDGDNLHFRERIVITDSRQIETLLVIPL
jgi:anthranilate 1,2-dioxygenase small subunit